MKLNLPDTVASAQDVGALIVEIRNYSRWYAHESIKQKVSSKTHASPAPTLTPALTALIHSWTGTSALTQAKLDALIAALEAYRKSATSVTITLAAPATGAIKSALVTWCRANIAPNVLISFEFNATLLGGMVIRSGSRVFDWSFRRQILSARQNFPEVLRRV